MKTENLGNLDHEDKSDNIIHIRLLKNRQSITDSLVISNIHHSIFGIDSVEPIPMEISGYIVDWNLDKDGNKIINSLDLKSVNYTYHNPFKDKENININEIS